MSDNNHAEIGAESSLDDELNALAQVVKSLQPLTQSARQWVLASAANKFAVGGVPLGKAPSENSSNSTVSPSEEESIGTSENPKVKKWLKDAAFTADELDAVFYKSGNDFQIIASDVPGKSMKEKTINAFILVGAAKFLATGEPSFSDQDGRDFCKTIGCYDATNHSKYMDEKGNALTGSKGGGWTLTMPGLKAAVEIVRGAK